MAEPEQEDKEVKDDFENGNDSKTSPTCRPINSDFLESGKCLDVDQYIEKTGECGRFQIRTQVIFIFFMLPLTCQVLIMYFAGQNPAWKCKKESQTCHYSEEISRDDGTLFHERCKMNRSDWEYTTSTEYSLVTQFDLVCEREYLAVIANSMLYIGWAFGGICLTYLADRYGRKRILFFASLLCILVPFATALGNNLILFIIGRAITGFALAAIVTIFVLVSEIVGPRFRSISGTIIWFYFAVALVTMAAEAYYLKSWKNLEIVCSIPFIIIIFFWSRTNDGLLKFDLICEREYLAVVANSMLYVGWAFGGICLTYLADRLGRKRILFSATLLCITVPFATAYANCLIVFIAGRVITGFVLGGGITVFVLATEFVGPRFRSLSGTIIWFYFTSALILMTIEAYYLQSWKRLETVCTVPFIIIVIFWRYIPESIRWLRVKGRLEEAKAVLAEVARVNGRPIPEEELMPSAEQSSNASFIDIFRPFVLGINTLIQCFSWFVCGMTFYGVSLASEDLGGNLYRDFILTSLVEFPANVLVIVLSDRYGRRVTVISAMFLSGLSCFGVAGIPSGTENSGYKLGRVVLGMLGKFSITLSFNAFYIWSAELHATVVRTQALGLVLVSSRIGAACSPFIVTELRYFNPAAPFILMGTCCVLATVLCLRLIETKDKPTAETIEDSISLLRLSLDGEKDKSNSEVEKK